MNISKTIEFKDRPALESYRLKSFEIRDVGDIPSHGKTGTIIHNLYIKFDSYKSFTDLSLTYDDALSLGAELLKAALSSKSAHEVMAILEEISSASRME